MKHTIGVAISTRFEENPTGAIRLKLAQAFVKAAFDGGYPVFFVDNSPNEEVLTTLRALGANGQRISDRALPSLGRAEALQQALAAGCTHILLSEPEKVGLVSHLDGLAEYSRQNALDIVFPRRSVESMDSHAGN